MLPSSKASCKEIAARGRNWQDVLENDAHFVVLLRPVVDLERPKLKVTDVQIVKMLNLGYFNLRPKCCTMFPPGASYKLGVPHTANFLVIITIIMYLHL